MFSVPHILTLVSCCSCVSFLCFALLCLGHSAACSISEGHASNSYCTFLAVTTHEYHLWGNHSLEYAPCRVTIMSMDDGSSTTANCCLHTNNHNPGPLIRTLFPGTYSSIKMYYVVNHKHYVAISFTLDFTIH